MATTGVANSWKSEVMSAGHCFNTTVSLSGTTASTTALTALSSTAGIAVGMAVTGTNIAANTFVSAIVSATAVTLSVAATGSATNTMTFTGDVFKMVLIKAAPTRTFDATQTNVGTPGTGAPSATNVGTDETSGTGYTSGGTALTNVGPSLPGNPTTTATISFANPSWTSASFSATAAVIQNTSTRLGGAAAPLNGRVTSVHDFGGTQTVSSGTFTVIMPTNDGSNALLRIA
jgi:hypothetical protein